jgi:A nuclease family of the HNH/ENDO VII superfamily with conserved AHH
MARLASLDPFSQEGGNTMVWRLLWRTQALLVAVMVGCAGTPRLEETGRGTAVVSIPRADMQPVVVEEEEFQQAVRQLARQVPLTGTPRELAERTFQLDPLSGNYLYLNRDKKLVPTEPGVWDGTLTKEDLETAERYRLWCRDVYGVYGDCLGGALVGGRYLDMQGRYMWALFLSKSGPWTPRFRKIFARAGMSLEDPANKMPLRGHYGPHPQRYHEIVYEELLKATKVCRSVVVCREKLREALQGLAREISTPGTELNQLVTQ